MIKDEWLIQVTESKNRLINLIKYYHPLNRQPGRREQDYITAPNAEWACTQVRKQIRENSEGDPIKDFEEALEQKDDRKIYKLLSDTWFGVPESTTCWQIEGFKEAVDLMDDPPE